MKKKLYILIILFPLWGLGGLSFSNDDDAGCESVDCLQSATQTGENTFGCLLDGEAFIPDSGINPLDCVYQFVNEGYYFALKGNKRDENNNSNLIALLTDDLQISEGGTYALAGIFSYTSSMNSREMTINKLYSENQTVSGTFWFDVIDQNGDLRQIREGRFDMQYTH
jgi:hypothetical protein